ncbi:MAG: hypothetical protein VW453_10775, partial [Rhodospirillaceae bacterium]
MYFTAAFTDADTMLLDVMATMAFRVNVPGNIGSEFPVGNSQSKSAVPNRTIRCYPRGQERW